MGNRPLLIGASRPEATSLQSQGKRIPKVQPAILALPSVIVSGEPNYLLNPAHSGLQENCRRQGGEVCV